MKTIALNDGHSIPLLDLVSFKFQMMVLPGGC